MRPSSPHGTPNCTAICIPSSLRPVGEGGLRRVFSAMQCWFHGPYWRCKAGDELAVSAPVVSIVRL